MSLPLTLEELLDYSDHERGKWCQWIAADPRRLALPFQPGGRFPTVNALLDHVFLVERRHLSRLEGGVPPDASGVAPGDWNALFEYAALVRADFRKFIADLTDAKGRESMTISLPSGPQTTTRRRLAIHIVLHEIRHLAQIAYAARLAGQEPPGQHDFFFSPDSLLW